MAITLLLCDSPEGLALLQYALIKSGGEFLIEVVTDGFRAVEAAGRIKPEVIVTETEVEGLAGVELVRRLADRAPDAHIVCWSSVDAPEEAAEILAAGARGYLLREEGSDALPGAIGTVLEGHVVLSARLAAELADHHALVLARGRELEISIAEATDKVELVTQAKAEFLANVSHEFRTPVTIAKGIAYVLKNRGIPEHEQREFLEKLESSLDKLMHLVDSILTIADLDRGAVTLQVAPVDLVPILGHTCDDVANQYPEVALERHLPEALTAEVDELRISEVVRQLLDNACRYTPEGEPVLIRARALDEGLVVTVTDHGQGVRRDVVTQAFNEPFTAGEEILRKERSGIGVGLHMARQLVLQHGGIMWADPIPGGGTRVSFCIPSDRSHPVAHPPLLGPDDGPEVESRPRPIAVPSPPTAGTPGSAVG